MMDIALGIIVALVVLLLTIVVTFVIAAVVYWAAERSKYRYEKLIAAEMSRYLAGQILINGTGNDRTD